MEREIQEGPPRRSPAQSEHLINLPVARRRKRDDKLSLVRWNTQVSEPRARPAVGVPWEELACEVGHESLCYRLSALPIANAVMGMAVPGSPVTGTPPVQRGQTDARAADREKSLVGQTR